MAGHNKWSKIKRKKAANDGKRSSVYTKMAKAIMVAVRTGGGGDPANNFKLKAAIDKAKEAGLPKSNIQSAIEKASGKNDADNISENVYEGYLPGGVAVMVFTATDNTNRTYSDVRAIFTKSKGSLGATGSVAYMFEKKGLSKVKLPENWNDELEEKLLEISIETGFDDMEVVKEAEMIFLSCPPENIEENSKLLEANIIKEFEIISSSEELIPATTVAITNDDDMANIEKALDALDDNDDVVDLVSNAEL